MGDRPKKIQTSVGSKGETGTLGKLNALRNCVNPEIGRIGLPLTWHFIQVQIAWIPLGGIAVGYFVPCETVKQIGIEREIELMLVEQRVSPMVVPWPREIASFMLFSLLFSGGHRTPYFFGSTNRSSG